MRLARLSIAIWAFLNLVACVAPPLTPEEAFQSLELKAGQTTRTELLHKLGPPTGNFEQDRVLTFSMTIEHRQFLPTIPYEGDWISSSSESTGPHSLVAEFDPQGVLTRASLIGVHPYYRLETP